MHANGFVIQEDDHNHIGGSLKNKISKLFEASLKVTVPDEPKVVPIIAACAKKEFGDYQWYMFFFLFVFNTTRIYTFPRPITYRLIGTTLIPLGKKSVGIYVLCHTCSIVVSIKCLSF